MLAIAAFFAFDRVLPITPPNNPSEPFIGGVPYLSAENLAVRATECKSPPALHFKLDRFPHLLVNNGEMAIFYIILRYLAYIICSFLVQEIHCEVF